jgi:hypothetical protein
MSEFMESKKLAIVIALIGAAATLGAALIAKPSDSRSRTDEVEAAERVQACQAQHGMRRSFEARQHSPEVTYFMSCSWPKERYADADGYLEIRVEVADGPGDSNASGENYADRITAPCPKIQVSYSFGSQGHSEHGSPFSVNADAIVDVEGEAWTKSRADLPFYPERGEIVVLHNGRHGLDAVSCL